VAQRPPVCFVDKSSGPEYNHKRRSKNGLVQTITVHRAANPWYFSIFHSHSTNKVMRTWKLSNVRKSHRMGDQSLLSRAPPCLEGKLSCWSRLHLQSLAPFHSHSTNEVMRTWKLSNVRKGHRMGDQNYLEILRASEGTLSCWSLHLQSLAPTPVSRRVDD
jgi:hypothetical protein